MPEPGSGQPLGGPGRETRHDIHKCDRAAWAAVPVADAMTDAMTDAREGDLAALAALSARVGADPRLVQGGGGNSSLKHGDTLWVKASGTWLAQALAQPVFVRLPLARVRAALDTDDAEARLAAMAGADGLRPSIETSLHALLPHAVVLHVHSVNAIAWGAVAGGRDALAGSLRGLRWAWVDYRRPGQPLTQGVAEAMAAADETPDVLVLGNHGLVVGAPDCARASDLLDEVERRLARAERAPSPPDLARLHAANDLGWDIPADPLLHALGTDPVALRIARTGALYPDHVVFLGERAAVAEGSLSQALASARDAKYAVVPGAGLLTAPGLSAGAEAMLRCAALVGLRIAPDDAPRYLGADDVAALTEWEAEAYRRARDPGARPV